MEKILYAAEFSALSTLENNSNCYTIRSSIFESTSISEVSRFQIARAEHSTASTQPSHDLN